MPVHAVRACSLNLPVGENALPNGAGPPFYVAITSLTACAVVHKGARPIIAPSTKLTAAKAVRDLYRR